VYNINVYNTSAESNVMKPLRKGILMLDHAMRVTFGITFRKEALINIALIVLRRKATWRKEHEGF
jgi:hypothetical protein